MSIAATLLGKTFGTYELQSLIGSGGMAQVYRAFDHNLQRPVAIKLLTDAAAAQPGLAARFQQEARFIARLRHPHIVNVYDYGEVDGLAYMVQELLPGPTLEQEIAAQTAQGGRFSRDAVVAICADIAAALDAAHATGIIHRDVKPANVLRGAHGRLVLTDFGIARGSLIESARNTQVGMVVGTPDYIAPEQAQGLPATPASDIYALGVVLFELLTGKRPFMADTPMGIMLGHIQQPPPALASLRPDLPPAVAAVIARALAKDPTQRFASAGALVAALDQAWPPLAAPDLHSAPTAVWASGPPAVPNMATQILAPTMAAQSIAPNLPTEVASAPPVQRRAPIPPSAHGQQGTAVRRIGPLPILSALLALLLLGGAALAFRDGAARPPAGAATSVAAAAVTAMAATSTPPEATTAPLASATQQPSPVPQTPSAQLHALLQQATDNGQLKDGKAFLSTLDAVDAALASGDKTTATSKLRALGAALSSDEVPAQIQQQAFALIGQIASGNQLDLSGGSSNPPPTVDKDKEKGKGKGKGK